ncbi:MAG: tRNA 2-thiouridine(34) synthase MnmA, partial [Azospirillum sp.]|nr:tRNA 2-thiouridine(34) synthase MnmA [Azospirillum sp.]
DAAAARVTVGPHAALARRDIALKQTNWLGGQAEAGIAQAKIRSTTAPKPARFARGPGETALVTLEDPEFGVAAGQACVLYDGTRVLGGGWISQK